MTDRQTDGQSVVSHGERASCNGLVDLGSAVLKLLRSEKTSSVHTCIPPAVVVVGGESPSQRRQEETACYLLLLREFGEYIFLRWNNNYT